MKYAEVFISYKSEDYEQALWLRRMLETNGVSCWMAPASIPGGSSYAKEIPLAIEHCRVFVLVMTERCQNSIWIPKELDRALNARKPVMPFVLENCRFNDDFNFYLSNVQQYAAYQNKLDAAKNLLRDIRALLQVPQEPIRTVTPPAAQRKHKKHLPLIAAIAAVCILAAVLLPKLAVKRVDAFQDLEVTFEGAAPYAQVKLTNHSVDPFLQSISYSASPESELDLGDKVLITANISKEDAKEQGYQLKAYAKEVIVENIPSALSDPALLSAEDVAALQEKAEKYIRGQGEAYPQILLSDGTERGISPENLAGCMTEFALLETATVCTHTPLLAEQKTLILPFCLTLEDVPYNWMGTTYYEDPVLVDYPALYGYFAFTGLVVDEAGNLIKEGSFDMQMSKFFESKDNMEITVSQKFRGEKVSAVLQKG